MVQDINRILKYEFKKYNWSYKVFYFQLKYDINFIMMNIMSYHKKKVLLIS